MDAGSGFIDRHKHARHVRVSHQSPGDDIHARTHARTVNDDGND